MNRLATSKWKTDAYLLAALLGGFAGLGVLLLLQRDKATSDDARVRETARSSEKTLSSSPPSSGGADAEVAPSASSDDLTQTDALVREQGRSVGGGSLTDALALEWAQDGELAVSMTPTPEGLFQRSSVQWELNLEGLTTAQARTLLPLDDSLPQMPGSLSRALGGVPTLEDCQRALRDPAALRLLEQVLADEVTLYALGGAPDSPARAKAVEEARALYADSEERLYAHLDTLGGYTNWSIMHRIAEASFRWEAGW